MSSVNVWCAFYCRMQICVWKHGVMQQTPDKKAVFYVKRHFIHYLYIWALSHYYDDRLVLSLSLIRESLENVRDVHIHMWAVKRSRWIVPCFHCSCSLKPHPRWNQCSGGKVWRDCFPQYGPEEPGEPWGMFLPLDRMGGAGLVVGCTVKPTRWSHQSSPTTLSKQAQRSSAVDSLHCVHVGFSLPGHSIMKWHWD